MGARRYLALYHSHRIIATAAPGRRFLAPVAYAVTYSLGIEHAATFQASAGNRRLRRALLLGALRRGAWRNIQVPPDPAHGPALKKENARNLDIVQADAA